MLTINKVELELIGGPDMSDSFRTSIGGGMSFIAIRKLTFDYTDVNPDSCKKRMTHNIHRTQQSLWF